MSAKASVLKPCGKPFHTNTPQCSRAAGLDNRRSCYKLHLMLMKSLAKAVVVHVSCVFLSLLVNNFFAVMGVLAEFASESKPQYHSQARLVE